MRGTIKPPKVKTYKVTTPFIVTCRFVVKVDEPRTNHISNIASLNLVKVVFSIFIILEIRNSKKIQKKEKKKLLEKSIVIA
jgi:hypothetical protein